MRTTEGNKICMRFIRASLLCLRKARVRRRSTPEVSVNLRSHFSERSVLQVRTQGPPHSYSSALLIGAHELNGVDLIAPGDYVDRVRDLDAIRLKGGLRKFHHEVAQAVGRIVPSSDGVSSDLLSQSFPRE